MYLCIMCYAIKIKTLDNRIVSNYYKQDVYNFFQLQNNQFSLAFRADK